MANDRQNRKTLKPIGLGTKDTLRLEMGFCLYGNDLDDTSTPIKKLDWVGLPSLRKSKDGYEPGLS